MSTPIVVTPIQHKQNLPQPPTSNSSNPHQSIYKTIAPPQQNTTIYVEASENGLSNTSSTSSTSSSATVSPMIENSSSSSTTTRRSKGLRVRTPHSHEPSKKTSNQTLSNSNSNTFQKIEQLATKRHVRLYQIESHIAEKDADGTMWLSKLPEDEPPKKLIDIPTSSNKNKVEFVDWQAFNGKTGIGYLLFTAKGAKYWADAASVRWIESGKASGNFVPGKCVFVVKNDKVNGLSYGVRVLPTSATSSSSGSSPQNDEDDFIEE